VKRVSVVRGQMRVAEQSILEKGWRNTDFLFIFA